MSAAEKAQNICKACLTDLGHAQDLGKKNGYHHLRCPDCDTVTVSPFPTVEELIAFYQSYTGTTDYLKKKDRKIKRAKGRIKRALPFCTSGKKFLDVGCNYGFTTQAALELGLDAHGIDIDNTAVSASQDTFGKDHFTCIAVQDYAAAGNKADIIYTADVIEHVPDPDSFVKAIADILNPGGVLFLGTPDSSHWRVPKDFITWNDVIPPEHIVLFSRKGMQHILEKHGLKLNKFLFGMKPGMRLIATKPR